MSIKNIVNTYIRSLPCKNYTMGLRDVKRNQWKTHTIEITNLADFYPAENPKYEYYIKPLEDANSHHFTLVDSISRDNLNQMKLDGLIPAMVIETSPNNYQVWIRFRNAMTYQQAIAASRYLAAKYDANMEAISASCFGICPEYKRTLENGAVFVPAIVETSETLNTNLDDKIIKTDQEQTYEEFVHSYIGSNYDNNPETKSQLQLELDEKCKKYIETARQEFAIDSADLMAMIWLYGDGYSRGHIISTMLENSENLIQRKDDVHNAQRYLEDTFAEAERRYLSNQTDKAACESLSF